MPRVPACANPVESALRSAARSLLGLGVLATVGSAGATARADDVDWSVKLGSEYDTNPRRAEGGSDSDGASRLLVMLASSGMLSESLRYETSGRFGGRLLYGTSEEDVVLAQATQSLALALSEGWSLRAVLDGKDRTERGGYRDYARGSATLGLAWLSEPWTLGAEAGYGAFLFKPDDDLSSAGPLAVVTGTRAFGESWSTSIRLAWTERTGREDRFVESDVGLVTQEGTARRDEMWTATLRLSWAGTRSLYDLSGTRTWNESNSWGKGFTRDVVSVSATLLPLGELLVRVTGSLQKTAYADRVLVDPSLALDDENRNSVTVSLELPTPLDGVSLEGHQSYYSQAFSGDDTGNFQRHVTYLGLALRPRAQD